MLLSIPSMSAVWWLGGWWRRTAVCHCLRPTRFQHPTFRLHFTIREATLLSPCSGWLHLPNGMRFPHSMVAVGAGELAGGASPVGVEPGVAGRPAVGARPAAPLERLAGLHTTIT